MTFIIFFYNYEIFLNIFLKKLQTITNNRKILSKFVDEKGKLVYKYHLFNLKILLKNEK